MLLEEQDRLNASRDMEASDARRLVEISTALEDIEADTAAERATALLTNLGFTEELRAREMRALSGGWKVSSGTLNSN